MIGIEIHYSHSSYGIIPNEDRAQSSATTFCWIETVSPAETRTSVLIFSLIKIHSSREEKKNEITYRKFTGMSMYLLVGGCSTDHVTGGSVIVVQRMRRHPVRWRCWLRRWRDWMVPFADVAFHFWNRKINNCIK